MKRLLMIVTVSILAVLPVRGQAFRDFVTRVHAAPESQRAAMVDSFMNSVGRFPLVEHDTLCHFLYRGSASSVSVAGDANGWSSGASRMSKVATTNLWYFTSTFEPDARLDYKFVLNNSSWILDPRNLYTVSGGFGPNSELRMPGYVGAPELLVQPSIPRGTLRDTVFFSSNLGNSRRIRIYAPPGYDESTDSLPVVVFHDGLDYISLAYTNVILDNLIHARRIRPVIAVFVPAVNRTAEYAGSQMDKFSAFIVDEVMAYVDASYRTRRDPSARATIGASNGGNIALWLGLNFPHMFGNIGAQSSNIIQSISTGFRQLPALALKLYLDLGTYDIPQLIPLVRDFIPLIDSMGYEYRYREYHEGHSWGNWRAHLGDALMMFFASAPLSAEEAGPSTERFLLHPNFPNPFNPRTTIRFELSRAAHVSLRIYDMLGREVARLTDEIKSAGAHEATWDAGSMPSGAYVYRLFTGGSISVGRMIYIK